MYNNNQRTINMSTVQYSLRLPEECNSTSWMDELQMPVYYDSSDDEYEKRKTMSHILKSKQSRDDYIFPSPLPLLRKNALNEYSPSFEEQMEKKYGLTKGKVYRFDENYHVSFPKYNKDIYSGENIKKVVGKFQEFVTIDIFRFNVDGYPYYTNRRNFEKRLKGPEPNYIEIIEV